MIATTDTKLGGTKLPESQEIATKLSESQQPATKLPKLNMPLPGPNAKRVVELDTKYVSP
jgi:hypothetical protein